MAFHPPGGGGSPTDLPVGIPIIGGTTNGVFYQNGSDELANDSNFTYDGTTVAVGAVQISTNGVDLAANNLNGTGEINFATGGARTFNTGQAAADAIEFRAYDVDVADYVVFATLTANNTPTFDLSTSTTIGGNTIADISSAQNISNKVFTNGNSLTGGLDLDGTPATDDTFVGHSTNSFNAGATIAQWEAVYLDSSSTWQLTDADAAATAGSVMIALATEAGTSTNPLRVALPGTFCRNDAWNWTVGGIIYLSTTPGALTQTAPSGTDDVVRICGWAVNADTIFWNPDPGYDTLV